ncbi:MAG TPA: sensor histidine kinase [Usitatibacter sp.]|nr:sensor histidine kinase [Usitatibacter sp.]
MDKGVGRAPCGAGVIAGLVAACLLLAGAPLASAQPLPEAAGAPAPWRVVLIRSWDALYAMNIAREQALRDALTEKAPRLVEIYTEEIDSLRVRSGIEPEFGALLKNKYRDIPVDLVIASGIEPLDFVTRYRDDIWPGVPIVFNGVIEGALEGWRRPKRTTGVTMAFDMAGTIALGLAVVPGARRAYVISGTSPFDRHFLDIALRQMRKLDRPIEMRYIVGATRDETMQRVEELSRNSFVVYLSMLRDGAGRVWGPGATALPEVVARSTVPVVTPVQSQWTRGPLGGSSVRLDAHGRAAGLLARRVLEGENPDVVEVRAEPEPVCEVNWNALQRWNIPERSVPARCEIVNRPQMLWRAYSWQFAALFAIILLQAVLLWSLVMQSRRRRRAEAELQARGAQLAQVARLSTIGALTASIAHEINQPMGAILSNTEAAQMMLEQGVLQPGTLREILADIRNEDLRASEVIKRLRKLLARHEWNPVALEVNSEVAEALRHVAFDAARRGVKLAPVFDPATPVILADSVNLQQVIINLVVNAMEAVAGAPPAEREVRIQTRSFGNGAEIVVADRGPGLSQDDEARLFQEPFTSKKDGMGLGLSIVRTIVEMFRGTVSYESNTPHGAIFRVRIPALGA